MSKSEQRLRISGKISLAAVGVIACVCISARVRWIGGVDILKNVRVDRILKITEGNSKPKP